ncbi:MAG: deoxynucleoside kinase, partial [Anaerolineales bacterium]|nr:deoxynucleoside kinase [Anaerolineales bacterium]
YLLLRAEQEQRLRQQPLIGVLDGGLDLDFHLFTKLFYRKGWLSKAEFLLLERLYTLLRLHLPPPEMFIYLKADISVITERFRHRARSLEIATLDDLQSIQALLEEWIPTNEPGCLFCIDTTQDDALYSNTLARLRAEIQRRLGGTG